MINVSGMSITVSHYLRHDTLNELPLSNYSSFGNSDPILRQKTLQIVYLHYIPVNFASQSVVENKIK